MSSLTPPYVYNLAFLTPDQVYTGSRRVRDAELATIRAENLPQGEGTFAVKGSIASLRQMPDARFPGTRLLPMRLPHTREELFSTEGVIWTTELFQGDPAEVPLGSDVSQEAMLRTYQPGTHYRERWNGAVLGPSLPGSADYGRWANQLPRGPLVFRVPLFGSAADTVGRSKVDTARTVVERDGTTVCESDTVTCEVRGEPGRYRVVVDATRSFTDISTRVGVVWDVDHDGTPALPVQVVRFSPTLDAANSAPARRIFAVPVSVQRNPGANPARVASLRVEVSYDDGARWRRAPVVGGKVWLLYAASGYVSLRATVTETAGNAVEQTIIRAYRLR